MKLELHNAIIESVSTRRDRSFKVVLGLPELPPEQAASLFASLNKEVVQVDVEAEQDDKSPSKRLRDRMFVYYMDKHGKKDGFSNWYINQMDKMGLSYLDKIDS